MPDQTLTVTRIGSAGDGIAQADDGATLPIARTLPGEHITARPEGTRATLLTIETPSADRVQPPCPHFNQLCGGCALQHWADAPYAAWKTQLVEAALVRAGFSNPAIAPLVRTPLAARRRMDFAVQRIPGGLKLGLHQAHSKTIIDVTNCAILHPRLTALLMPLRGMMAALGALRLHGSVLCNLVGGVPDLLIRTDGPLAATDRSKLAEFARAWGIGRIAWVQNQGTRDVGALEIAALLALPAQKFGDQRVEVPPGAFLQASDAGEAAIVAAVLAGLPEKLTGRSRAIELFAGVGTISFPLAKKLRVTAYEGDGPASAALRRAQSGSRVEAVQRDLVRQPLSVKELSGAAMIVLDPPYAGAALQMPAIAASGVSRVAYVSCNPVALARDAAMLRDANYSMLYATPIDQFLFSAQVECVAIFAKP